MYEIPIIYIFYQRPDLVVETFEPIARIRPKKLYLFQDGPKDKNEINNIKEAREIVLKKINWPCQVVKIFREKILD